MEMKAPCTHIEVITLTKLSYLLARSEINFWTIAAAEFLDLQYSR